jgi:organic hydroperoxide reductase OsmC/OhrA
MHDFPHHYGATAETGPTDNVTVSSPRLPSLRSQAPAEFGGPGDQWSPETLLVAAVADCFVLSFRAIARASRFDWESLRCEVQGTLDRLPGGTQFTAFTVHATLRIGTDADEAKARKLLEKSEHSCLVTNSLKAAATLAITLQRTD